LLARLVEFLRWATRQIILTRVYATHPWTLGLAVCVFYCGTMLWGLFSLSLPASTVPERVTVAWILLAILLPGIQKGRIRSTVAHEVLREEAVALEHYGSRYWQLAPWCPE
jgi:hypothetical protein